jgi:dTDP-4-amino-4,6-dideoxygalactose transaminase
MSTAIPLFKNEFDEQDIQAVAAVLQSGWLTQGDQVAAFENEFAKIHGVRSAVAVCNCTAALHMALSLAGVGPGDEVIVPSLTFVASVNAVRYTGASPVFADIDSLAEPVLCPDTIATKITPRTKAVVVVHYGGYACNMDGILELAAAEGLTVIEDAAHGPGTDERGRWMGTLGDFGCFSFYGNKNLSTGEGGMLLCRRPADIDRARMMRSHGMTTSSLDRKKGHATSYDVELTGYNYRFDEMRAAIGRNQLKKLDERHILRKRAVETYRRLLEKRDDILVPFAHRNSGSYHIMPILMPDGIDQHVAMTAMRTKGFFTSLHYPPIHRFHDFIEFRDAHLPLTAEYCRRVLTLPLYPGLSNDEIARIVKSIPKT